MKETPEGFRGALRAGLLAGDLVVAAAALMIALPLWVLPWPLATRLGNCYGRVLFLAWPRGRRVGMINLRRAYGPAITRSQARRLIFQVFGSLGQSFAETIQFSRLFKRGGASWESFYDVEDPELEAKLLADPRIKIFVTAHLGSWEVAVMMAGLRAGRHSSVIARRIENSFLNAAVRRLRLGASPQWIDKRRGASEALRRLRAGESIALLADENGGYKGVFVDFFDRPASTGRLAALLSLTTGAPIVLGAAVRRPGTHRFFYRVALLEPPAGRQDAAATVREVTQQIARVFETWIREDPAQWRWIHWRWKTRPDGSEETYTRRDLRECFRAQNSLLAEPEPRPACEPREVNPRSLTS